MYPAIGLVEYVYEGVLILTWLESLLRSFCVRDDESIVRGVKVLMKAI